jgi:FkbM family methyltransferase
VGRCGGHLHESFVVLDVGVQGGENPRWHLLGPHLIVHGFDAIQEVVEGLRETNAGNPRRVYHWMAAGSADEERTFYFNAADPCSSSFFRQGDDRFGLADKRIEQARKILVRRLDGLLEAGVIPPSDFLKVDVEGAEKEVMLGAPKMLSGLLGIETETNFGISPMYREGHLPTLHALLSAARMRVFELNFNRVPRHSFVQAAGQVPEDIGKPATFNVLFCRDLIEETDQPGNYTRPCEPESVDRIIKAMIIYELHGLSDIALDTAVHFRDTLGSRMDVEKAISLLADPLCRAPGHVPVADRQAELAFTRARLEEVERDLNAELATHARLEQAKRDLKAELATTRGRLEEAKRDLDMVRQRISTLEGSISWRVTRPLRAVRRALLG